MIRSELLAACSAVGHGHTERSDGAVGPRGGPQVGENRERLSAFIRGPSATQADAAQLVVPEQVHGANVVSVDASHAGRGHGAGPAIAATDGLVTATRGIALFTQGADCPLLAMVDPTARVIAAVHSGWRGTNARIAAHAVRAMDGVGAHREDLRVAVFPGIGACCFEVGDDVRSAFSATFGAARATPWFRPRGGGGDRLLFDLRAAIVATLSDEGVASERMDVVPGCTMCDGRFWSHRGSRGGPERHGLAVVLR